MSWFKRKSDHPAASSGPDVEARIREVEEGVRRRTKAEAAGHVGGRHYTEWIPTLDELRSQRRDDDALALLDRLFPAIEEAAKIEQTDPPPGWYERAAILHRRKKDYAAEVAVLERYMTLCPPGRSSQKISDRLDKAHKLLANR